jgi:hypothetical protein
VLACTCRRHDGGARLGSGLVSETSNGFGLELSLTPSVKVKRMKGWFMRSEQKIERGIVFGFAALRISQGHTYAVGA